MLAATYVLWVLGAAARAASLPRLLLWRGRLPLFTVFLVAASLQSAALLHSEAIGDYAGAILQQRANFALMAVLHLAACIEAAWWLASSVPNFRLIGAALMGLSVFLAHVVGGHGYGTIGAAEQSVGLGLGVFLGVTLAVHRATLNRDSAALWHAGALAALSAAQGLDWALPEIGLLADAAKLAAALAWLWKVRTPPAWRAESLVDRATAERRVRDLGKLERVIAL